MNNDPSEELLIEELHDQTMSDNPLIASRARLAKQILPLFATALDEEITRTKDFEIVSSAVMHVASVMLATQIRYMEKFAGPIPDEALEGAIAEFSNIVKAQVAIRRND